MAQEILYDKESILTRLKTKLETLNISYVKFFKLLQYNKAYLSGSYLLGSICNFDFKSYLGNTIIDIFVFDSKRNSYFENQIYILFFGYLSFIFSKKFAHEDKELEGKIGSLYGINACTYLYDYGLKKDSPFIYPLNIQIIYIDAKYQSDIKTYVNDFDLNICSNYYDGNELYIKNLDSIINKCAIYTIKNSYIRIEDTNIGRFEKYSCRGFSINISYDNDLYNLISDYDINNNNNIDKKVIIIASPTSSYYELINRLDLMTETIYIYIGHCYDNEIDLSKFNFPLLLKKVILCEHGYSRKYVKITGIPKLPYGCELYINNDKISL